jgi:hypothetical protein
MFEDSNPRGLLLNAEHKAKSARAASLSCLEIKNQKSKEKKGKGRRIPVAISIHKYFNLPNVTRYAFSHLFPDMNLSDTRP